MSPRGPDTSDRIGRELASLADGSLAPGPRRRLLARLEDDRLLAEELTRQRRAVELIARAGGRPAPSELHDRVSLLVGKAHRRRPRVPRTLLGGAVAVAGAAAATLAIMLIPGGGSVSMLGEAVALTKAPVLLPAPLQSVEQGAASRSGWRPEGERVGRISGRLVTTVFYASRDGSVVGYVIVGGPPLKVRGGTVMRRDGVVYRRLRAAGRDVTTWVEGGHTHVLSGKVGPSTLLEFAALNSG